MIGKSLFRLALRVFSIIIGDETVSDLVLHLLTPASKLVELVVLYNAFDQDGSYFVVQVLHYILFFPAHLVDVPAACTDFTVNWHDSFAFTALFCPRH